MKRRETDHVELQSRLLTCVGVDVDPECERLSAYVVQAMRPSWGGDRTEVYVFGVCRSCHGMWRELVHASGGHEGVCVPWSGLGTLLAEMREVGWVA